VEFQRSKFHIGNSKEGIKRNLNLAIGSSLALSPLIVKTYALGGYHYNGMGSATGLCLMFVKVGYNK